MRLCKLFLIIGLATSIGLLCVWQQVELIKVSYEIERASFEVARLLDQNNALRYNVASLSSPSRLAMELVARNLGLVHLQDLEVVRLVETTPRVNQRDVAVPRGRRSLFSYFSLRAQAEADQVK